MGILQTIGVLLMVQCVFRKSVAYLGIATGATGIVSEALRPVLGGLYAVYGVLILAWFAAIAWELYRLSRRSRPVLLIDQLDRVGGQESRHAYRQ